jgi:catechol 2,3-dioxygenase-like lactoylglutathione lyase family enzyme
MIDHIKLFVADPKASRAFYEAALEPLGYRVLMDFATVVGMGKDRPDFWLAPAQGATTTCHVSFRAESEFEVQRFHAAAVAAGGTDNGGPASGPSTTRTTTERSPSTRTATTPRPSTTERCSPSPR